MCVYIKSPGWLNTNKLDKNISGFIHSFYDTFIQQQH